MAITVPELKDFGVAPQQLPGAFQQAPQRMMQNMDLITQQGVKEGAEFQQAGRDFVGVQGTIDDAAVKDTVANALSKQSDILTNPQNGYLATVGKDAIDPDRQQKVNNDLQEVYKEAGANMTTPAQKNAWASAQAQLQRQAAQQINEHATSQAHVYNVKSTSDLAESATQDMISNASSFNQAPDAAPSAYTTAYNTAKEQYTALAKLTLGETADPKAIDNFVQANLTKAHIQVLGELIADNNTKGAQTYFDKFSTADSNGKFGIAPSAWDQCKKVLQTANANADAVGTVTSMFNDPQFKIAPEDGGGLDYQKMQDNLTATLKDEPIKLEAARKELDFRQTQWEKNTQAANQQSFGTLQKQVTDGANWSSIVSSKEYTALQLSATNGSKWANDYLAHLSSYYDSQNSASKEKVNDAELFGTLMKRAGDPDQAGSFINEDLAKYQGALTPSHLDYLQKLQSSINSKDLKAMDGVNMLNKTVSQVKADMEAAGFNLNPGKNDTDAAEKLASFEGSLRDRLIAVQAERKDKPLTTQEMRDIALEHLKTETLSDTGYGGFFQTKKPVYQMTDAEKNAPWELSDTDRANAIQKLKDGGYKNIDEKAIQRYYKKSKGVL